MSDAFRQSVISTLINEVSLLTGGQFEQFGYRVMEIVFPAQWVERGTTVEGAPRGYTVDTSTNGAALVAEMSSESDYFHGDMGKPTRDLHHSIILHPDVKRIWLLSSREATAGETTKCANLETEFIKEHKLLTQVEILDARKIAVHIFNNIETERFVSSLTTYLPSLGRLADENAFSHRIPIYSGYQQRLELEDIVIARLTDSSCVVVSGISGIGKSALVAHVAERLRSDFDTIIWYDARNLGNVAELSDVDIRRIGTRHNITSLLLRHKCLLILDDAVLSKENIAQIDCGESKVILTCQVSSEPNSIEVGEFDFDSARILLQAGVTIPCSDEVFQRVFSSIGGYPLLLSALNRVAQDDGWEAVDDCCEDATSSIEDERHNKICQRILMRHRESLALELEFVNWCGGSCFDSELAAVCVSPRAVKNLQKRAFLAATTSGDIRVHDVVYKSILAVIDVTEHRDTTFRDKLDNFICSECEKERHVLSRIVTLHAPLVKRLVGVDSRPSFIYSLALARMNDTPVDLLGDPVAAAKSLVALDHWDGREIEIRAVIEVVEALYTLTSANYGVEAAKASLNENIAALDLLLHSPLAKNELLRDLKHHYAKMLIRLEYFSEAETEFRSILSEYPMFAAGRLQLARLLGQRDKKTALDECGEIINQHLCKQGTVSPPILLETLRLLANFGSANDVRPHEGLIISCLEDAREFDKALTLRLIASVAQKTWYKMPKLVSRMFDAIEWRDAVPASDSERFDWAQAHKAAAKVAAVGDSRRRDFLIAADDTYKSIVAPRSYNRVQHAEALILLNRFEEANSVLDLVPDSDHESFWWHRKSQALFGLQHNDTALEAINNALQLLKGNAYKAAFLKVRHDIRESLSDAGARDDLLAAINTLPEGDKYRKELESKLADLTK